MNALVVGCGYLGSRVAALWQAAGHHVSVTTRDPSHADSFYGQGLHPILCDITQPATLKSLPEVDVLVCAVARARTANVSMHELYVDGLRALLENVPPPARWLHVSSSSVYEQTDGGWVDEMSATEPQEQSGRVILEAENVLHSLLPDAIVLRFSGIYGPGRWLRSQSLRAGEPIVGDMEKWLNLIHVDDGAAAVAAAGDHAAPGQIYNICDNEPVRRRDFYTLMAERLGAPEPQFILPAPGTPLPPHERGNRRIQNRRLREELGVVLTYPTYREGLNVK